MVTKLPLTDSCHSFNLFGTIHDSCLSWILSRYHSILINIEGILTLVFESVVNSDKIGEDNYKATVFFLLKFVTLLRLVTCGVRKERDFVCFRKIDSQSLAAISHLLQAIGILFDF
ncbi:hypothetical protein AVEN_81368-1 [Araneus ventricosus]|uniref:Uncharacterized protein n=1 Tax=Araneus ventricosus TaxID=182803 RepID=A0A4Y2B7K2_ARAVE|nr:hypothetical protein AVEN_81368-1 [Araneus ventricosus]